MRAARKPPGPKAPPPTGGEELKEARRIVEDYIAKMLPLRRQLDEDLIRINTTFMTQRFEKLNRDDLARWARKETAEKVLRTEKVSPEEFRVETSGEGLGKLRYSIKAADGTLRIDSVQRQCDFCLGKGQCPHCDGKGCKDCSKTGLCFVCEGRIWEDYSRCR